jgi:hypothetical protein
MKVIIKQMVELLGLVWDDEKMESEHFIISDRVNLLYKFTIVSLFYIGINSNNTLYGGNWTTSSINLYQLLNGEIKISKPPYKPTFRDKYFISNITMPELFSCTYWFNDKINQYHLDNNLIVKTREEAVQCSKSILKFLETEAQK